MGDTENLRVKEAYGPSRNGVSISRSLAVAFSLVALVGLVTYLLLLTLVAEVSHEVTEMRAGERTVRASATLATAVRERYMHVAHAILEHLPEHLEHANDASSKINAQINELAKAPSIVDHSKIEELVSLDKRIEQSLSALQSKSQGSTAISMSMAGRERIRSLTDKASIAADALALSAETAMVENHVRANRASNLALVGGGICAFLLIGLAFAFTVRLRRTVLSPLDRLTTIADKIGAGDYSQRASAIGEGEWAAVGAAIDSMADSLLEREKKLVESARLAALGQIAATMAHEINNPITVIRGYLKTMRPDDDPRALAEELRILDEEAAQCQRITEDLVASAREPQLRCSQVNLGPFLRECAQRFQARSGGSSHEIRVEVEDHEAVVDSRRLRQVMFNLLKNAAEASPAHSAIEIHGCGRSHGEYRVSVLDRGSGIRDADKKRVFAPLISLGPNGNGLGLAVCQQIVRAHGGRILVEDREEGGTVFHVDLPPRPTDDGLNSNGGKPSD